MIQDGRRIQSPASGGSGRVFRYLFFGAVLILAALAGLHVWIQVQYRAAMDRETALADEVARQRQALAQLQLTLDDSRAALEKARETIGMMEEYSLLAPDGTPPAYTQLYPELYAQPWEGEPVTADKLVCLTFDDGPSSNTDRILAILEEYGVKATFFVVGKTGEADQQRMRDIVAAGHTLAVHSWSHSYTQIYASVEAYLEDFNKLYEWIYEVTGVYPQIFRFPGGSINAYNRGTYQEIIGEMTRRGFLYYDWNASAQDATVTPLESSVIAENCLLGLGRERVIVLAHDSAARSTTVDALPAVIEGYRDAGYTFAALSPGVKPIIMGYRVSK